MKKLPNLGDPNAGMRQLIEGTGTHLRYWPNGNFGDEIRGKLFLVGAELYPKSITVVDPHHFPYLGPDCWTEVIRNPTASLVDLMHQKIEHPDCRCRIIFDCTAPWWGPGDVIWPDGEPEPAAIETMRQAAFDFAEIAHLITVPWDWYAESLREHLQFDARHVPDFNPDDEEGTFPSHALGWGLALQHVALKGSS